MAINKTRSTRRLARRKGKTLSSKSISRSKNMFRSSFLESLEDRRLLTTLAFTDFNDSTIGGSSNVKATLNWTLDGLEDPGDMAALNAGGSAQVLFDSNAFVQDIFIPGLNTGNGDTFWTTDVPITVAAGSSVTLTDVTLNSISVSGGQAENVDRRNDYTVTLIDPSAVTVEDITIADTVAGTNAGQPLVTFDFTDVALSDPGTYTLRIKGGDFTGAGETGNHTGFDNLSINGVVTTAGGPNAVDDDYTLSDPITEDETLTIAAPGVLGNDSAGGGSGLIVYEGFQYVDAVDIDGGASFPSGNTNSSPFHLKGESDGDPGDVDATGLDGVYVDNGTNTSDGDHWFVVQNSLSFGDLPTAGNRISFRDNLDDDNHTRGLTADAQNAIGNANEIWFSMLVNPIEKASASRGGFALSDSPLNGGAIINTTSGVSGFGFGSTSNHNFRPYAWDGTSRVDGDAATTTTLNQTNLLVGHISFDSGAGGTDEYTLYDYQLNAGSVVGGTLNAIATTIEVDVDQTTLDLINLNRQRKFDADELRIGTSLNDVLGLSSGGGGSLSITDYDTTSLNGATVTVNADGEFTYDPTTAPTIQALNNGDVLTDTFTYTITDGTVATTTLLTEGFENPDVTLTAPTGDLGNGTIPAGWVGATQGFGASRRGITDESTGDFNDPTTGEQAFAFRYTNSGLTTAEGTVGTLTAGATYTISFDVVRDLGRNDGTPYTAEFVAFDPGADRTEHRGGRPGTTLASTSGSATSDDLYTTVTFQFTPGASHTGLLGKDIGLRFLGATTSAIIDNVQITAEAPVTDTATVSILVNGVTDGASFGAMDDDYCSPGDISIFTGGANERFGDATKGEANAVAATFTNTIQQSDTSHTLNGTGDGIALHAGHHLVLYNARFDTDDQNSGSNRHEIQTNLNLDGGDLAIGYSQGYIRRDSGSHEAITSAGGIINVASDGQELRLESYRTDSSGEEDLFREADSTGIQLLKLDDSWNYASLVVRSDTGDKDLNSVANQTVVYDDPTDGSATSQEELDVAGFTYDGSGNITLVEGGHYIVFANTYIEASGTSRNAYYQELALNGTSIGGTKTTVYQRGTQSTQEGAATIGTIIAAGAGDLLSVRVAEERNDGGDPQNADIKGMKSGITIVRLPDTGEFLSTESDESATDLGTQDLNPGNDDDGPNTAVAYSTVQESSASFVEPDNSTVQVTTTDNYLFLNQWFYETDADAAGGTNRDRQVVSQGYQVNGGGVLNYGQSARYNRDDNPSTSAGNWGGAVLSLQENDQIQVLTGRLAGGNDAPSDFVSLQGVRLGSLFVQPVSEDDASFTVSAAQGVLANDTPTDATIIGINGTDLLTGTSVKGAAVTVGTDGSFSYDPTGSSTLQALATDESTTDTFTYTIVDDAPPITAGVTLNFDANDPASGVDSDNWDSTTANASQNWDFGTDVTLEDVSAETNVLGISQAYRFTGGAADDNGSWNAFAEADAATWEFWLKPADTGDPSQIILESGGTGTGFTIWYEPGTLGDNTGTVNFTIDGGTPIETVSATIDTTEFRHITSVYEPDINGAGVDLLQIYVDGVLIDDNVTSTTTDNTANDSDVTNIGNWSGGDGAGLGNPGQNSVAIESFTSKDEYSGDISIFRFYESKALTDTEVQDNYDAIAPATDTATVTVKVDGVNDPVVITSTEDGSVIEDESTMASETDTGVITFADVDLTDTHTASVEFDSTTHTAQLGDMMSVSVTTDTTGTGTGGEVTWDYSVDDADIQFLGKGETITETYTVSIVDGMTTSFDGATLDSFVNLDIPNSSLGNITFDATNDELDFDASGNTDMWGARNNAPIAWVVSPATAVGDTWFIETEVRLNNTTQNGQVAGITFYGDPDGSKPDFSFGLDNWNPSDRRVRLQGLGDNNPNVPGTDITGDSVFLRAEVTENGASDTYNFFYRENDTDTWSQLGGGAIDFSSSFANSRAGLFYKTNGAKDGTAFTQLAVGAAQDVDVVINGSNDQPEITVGTGDSDSAVLMEMDTGLMVTRTLSVEDVDTTDMVNASVVTGVTVVGDQGLVTMAALEGMISVTSTNPVIDGVATTGTIDWKFDSGSEAFDHLATGEMLTLTYTIQAMDDSGVGATPTAPDESDTATKTITITITGTNDSPVLTLGSNSGSVTEDDSGGANETATGTLSIADVDTSDTHTVSVSYNMDANWSGGTLSGTQIAAISNTTSNFTADSNSWDYTVANSDIQFLADSETITLTFTVTATDDSTVGTPATAPDEDDSDSEIVTITIMGANDAPITMNDTHTGVNEDAADAYDVLANDTDPDTTDTIAVAGLNGTTILTGISTLGSDLSAVTTGDVTFDPTTSAYLQTLGAGETATDTYTYTVADQHGATDTAMVSVEVDGRSAIEVDMTLNFPVADFATNPGNDNVGDTIELVLAGDMPTASDSPNDLLIKINGTVLRRVPAAIVATESIIVTGSDDDDTLVIDTVNGDPTATGTLTFNGGGGTNAIVIDDSLDDSDSTVVVTPTGITGLLTGAVTMSNVHSVDLTSGAGADTFDLTAVDGGTIAMVTVNGGDDDSGKFDTFDVKANNDVTFMINGNDPTVAPGDVLNITQDPIEQPIIFPATSNGTWMNGTVMPVTWTSIEQFTINGEQPFQPGDLYIQTTPQEDRVILNAWAGKSDVVSVEINGVTDIPRHGVSRVVVDALEGDDHIGVAANLCIPTKLDGGAGNDYIAAGPKDDVVLGSEGNDRLLGGGGSDTIIGGAGRDRIDGRDGSDTLYGDSGEFEDGLAGTITIDVDPADAGNDMIIGGGGNDTIDGGDGDDELAGGSGNDIVKGGAGDDELTGESGHDVLFGGDGKDWLWGRQGNDLLFGGLDEDCMFGGSGSDLLSGDAPTVGGVPLTATQLRAALVEWNNNSPETDPDGAWNAVMTSVSVTTADDGAMDSLTGGLGSDRFLLTGTDQAFSNTSEDDVV